MSTNGDIEKKVSSALALSSISFVLVVLFIITWSFKKRIKKLSKPFFRRGFNLTRKGLERSRKIVAKKLNKPSNSASNAETAEVDENSGPPHLYATVDKNRKDKKGTSNSREVSSDSPSDSDSENEPEGNGMISVELHAYQTVDHQTPKTVGLVSYQPENGKLDHEVVFSSLKNCEAKEVDKCIDYTTGCSIYDEVEGCGKAN